MNKKLLFQIIFVTILTLGCSKNNTKLKYISNNHIELEKAISYFKQEGNKEKLDAAYYLIENLEGNHFPAGKILEQYKPLFDLLDSISKKGIDKRKKGSNEPIEIIKNKWDALQKHFGSLDNIVYLKDVDYITSDYIIDNVNLAYKSWKKNPWCKHVTFSEFCEYILPYKVLDEPFEKWREYFIDKYSWLKDSLKNKYDPVEACKLINKDVSRWFKFNSLFYKFPFNIGFSRLIKGKIGVCPQMVVITAYAARALGIPVVVDFIPNYGNRRGKHMWLSVLDTNNNFVPFNAAGAEWLPFGSINCNNTWRNKITKVFRRSLVIQKKCLNEIATDKNEVPTLLNDNKYIDVTAEYIPVTDVEINLKKFKDEIFEFAYLCVFNNKEWVPVHWGNINNSVVTFTKMGRDVVYMPVYCLNGSLIPANDPFILAKDGNITMIEKYKGIVQSIKLLDKYPWYITQRKDTANKILKGDIYELLYWENEWKSLGRTCSRKRCNNKKLRFRFSYR